jgi:hypothetical protein
MFSLQLPRHISTLPWGPPRGQAFETITAIHVSRWRPDRLASKRTLRASFNSNLGSRADFQAGLQMTVETDCLAGHIGLEVRRETGKE